jgi:hypothetical protein
VLALIDVLTKCCGRTVTHVNARPDLREAMGDNVSAQTRDASPCRLSPPSQCRSEVPLEFRTGVSAER